MTPRVPLVRRGARPAAIDGPLLRVRLDGVAIGDLCEFRDDTGRAPAHGIVVGIDGDMATLSILGSSHGLSQEIVVFGTGHGASMAMSDQLLGAVIDATGAVVDRLAPPVPAGAEETRPVTSPPVDVLRRRDIDTAMPTGVAAIDAMLTCGIGQRMGIFAAAGCGKTTLVDMIMEFAQADVLVLALIGERGREVASTVNRLRAGRRPGSTIVVYSTSDAPPAARRNAGLMATAIAEYFRDCGKHVLLQFDSVTRYARALRDIALATGEPPARRGYPASVFEELPRLVERPGRTAEGAITAFYTVLLEDEDLADPIGEEIKSLLDGHIYLSATLAGAGRFPAIDVLKSESRLFQTIAEAGHVGAARAVRKSLRGVADLQMMRDLGEYRAGENPESDRLIAMEARAEKLLRQDAATQVPMADAVAQLQQVVRG